MLAREENRWPKNTRTTNLEGRLARPTSKTKLHKLVECDPEQKLLVTYLAAKFHHRSPKICSTTKMFAQLSFGFGPSSVFPRFTAP